MCEWMLLTASSLKTVAKGRPSPLRSEMESGAHASGGWAGLWTEPLVGLELKLVLLFDLDANVDLEDLEPGDDEAVVTAVEVW